MGDLRLLRSLGLCFLLLSPLGAHHQRRSFTMNPALPHEIKGDSILVIDAAADPQSGPALLKVTFTAQASGGTGKGYVYFWDFDNSDGFQVESFGDTVIYPFGHPGVYTVTVRAWDDAGNFGVKEITVEVDSGNFELHDPIFIQDSISPPDDPLIIEGNEISPGNNYAIQLSNVENVIIRRNWIHNSTPEYPAAIEISGVSRGIRIEENIFEDNNGAILAPCTDCYVGYNVIERTSTEEGSTGFAVQIMGGSGDLTNIVVEGNVISHTGETSQYGDPNFYDIRHAIFLGGEDVVVRNNIIYETMGGGIFVQGSPESGIYSENVLIKDNVVRNSFPWLEAGITLCYVKGGEIINNYVDMNWREAITSYGCTDIEISNNISLGHCRLVDSDESTVHHNTILYQPTEPPESLPHVQPPGNFGIVVEDVWPEVAQPEGDPGHSEEVLIADNLIVNCDRGLQIAGCVNVWLDWNALGWRDPQHLENNRDYYLRLLDKNGSAVVGCNNLIRAPEFVAPLYGNYLLASSDPLSALGHDGRPVGAIWSGSLPEAPDTSEVVPGIQGPELLVNGDAESGVPDPWWMHSGDSQPAQLEVVSEAQFGELTVTPHSGNYFFLLSGSAICTDGYAMVSAYQEWLPLETNWDEVDSGGAIFKLQGFYWLENDTPPPSVVPSVEFYDEEDDLLYVAEGKGMEEWVPDSSYRPLNFYGQVPPLARKASVRIMAIFLGEDVEHPFALAFDDISLTLFSSTPGTDERNYGSSDFFSLYQNRPNPFDERTLIEYETRRNAEISLRIYNAGGQKVKTLVEGFFEPGYYRVTWDGKDDLGEKVGRGVYFYRLEVNEEFSSTRKLLMLKCRAGVRS